jgi:hypothetical protein
MQSCSKKRANEAVPMPISHYTANRYALQISRADQDCARDGSVMRAKIKRDRETGWQTIYAFLRACGGVKLTDARS